MIRKLTLLVLLTFAVFSEALAKVDPYVEDPDAEWGDVSDPASIWSWRAMSVQAGLLGEAGDVDAFTVTFPEATADWNFEVMVPVCEDHFEAFFPSVAVIGPGLGVPEADALPFELPEGMGAVVFSEESYKERYAEKEQRSISTNNPINDWPIYFSTPQTIDIPQAGDYLVVIFEPDDHTGAYMFSLIGGEHDLFGDRQSRVVDAAFDALFSGSWMGNEDCVTDLT